jgi:hypothetical protein
LERLVSIRMSDRFTQLLHVLLKPLLPTRPGSCHARILARAAADYNL